MMDEAAAKALRTPFPKSQIGKLPKPTKKDNPKGKCDFCGGWHGLPAIHLDYVGHAAVTSRLLEVDPAWTWRPVVLDERGAPLLTAAGTAEGNKMGLWIALTVQDVTRYGFGDGNTIKECISDAIRNAAMRFGVALDLWSKEDLDSAEGTASSAGSAKEEAPAGANAEPAAAADKAPLRKPETPRRPPPDDGLATGPQRRRMFALAKEHGLETEQLRELIVTITGQDSTAKIPRDQIDLVFQAIEVFSKPEPVDVVDADHYLVSDVPEAELAEVPFE